MTEIPETPSELAKRLWDTALEHLKEATNTEDIDVANCYSGIAQTAIMAAQFALNNQALLVGMPIETPSDPSQFGLPPGAPPLPESMRGLPPGAPPIPSWGRQ